MLLFVPLQVVALKAEVCCPYRLCSCHRQAWAASFLWLSVQSAAVTILLLCCQKTGKLLTFDTDISQPRVLLLMPLAHWPALNLGTCFHLCCGCPVHLTNTSCALRPLSEALRWIRDTCTVEVTVLCRTLLPVLAVTRFSPKFTRLVTVAVFRIPDLERMCSAAAISR